MQASKKVLISLIGIFLALPVVTFAQKEGTNSGGGGTTIQSQSGQRILVDLYKFDQPRNPGIILKSKSLKNFKVDYLCLECGSSRGLLADDQKLTSVVRAKLSSLATRFPLAANAIREELKTPIVALAAEAPALNAISISAHVDLSEVAPELQTTAKLAAYFESDKLVGISAKEFNKLAIEDQAGLLIHEAIRTLQKQFNRNVSNRDIQEIVLAIISENIQSQQKLSSQINSLTEVYSQNQVEQLKSKACQAQRSIVGRNFPNAESLCQSSISQINLEMAFNAWKDVYTARGEMLRTAQSEAEVILILGMVQNFEGLYLMAATNALAPNDSIYSGLIRSGNLTMRISDFDIYNGR